MGEDLAAAFEALEDEALAAEEAGAETLGELDVMLISPIAHRNEPRWHTIALVWSGNRMILPGYGALNAT